MIAIPAQFDVQKDDWREKKVLLPNGHVAAVRERRWAITISFYGCCSCLALQLVSRINASRYRGARAEHLLCVSVETIVWPAVKIELVERGVGWNMHWHPDGTSRRIEAFEPADFSILS